MKSRSAGMSDVGRCRQTNQDHFLVDESLGVYAIADGMGGHAAGEVASGMAIETLASTMRTGADSTSSTPDNAAERLRNALNEGNRRIVESMHSRAEWRGMGTTIVALVMVRDVAVIGYVGDSRAYLLRDGDLRQLTSDHSWVNEQVKAGVLTAEEAHRHPRRNIVTRAMGNMAELDVDVVHERVEPGDVITLCSDGLNGMLTDHEIRDTLVSNSEAPQAACRALVDRANANGGEDNITVVVMARDS